jgi:hypothetical protein
MPLHKTINKHCWFKNHIPSHPIPLHCSISISSGPNSLHPAGWCLLLCWWAHSLWWRGPYNRPVSEPSIPPDRTEEDRVGQDRAKGRVRKVEDIYSAAWRDQAQCHTEYFTAIDAAIRSWHGTEYDMCCHLSLYRHNLSLLPCPAAAAPEMPRPCSRHE